MKPEPAISSEIILKTVTMGKSIFATGEDNNLANFENKAKTLRFPT
jgi:hypothetical protein